MTQRDFDKKMVSLSAKRKRRQAQMVKAFEAYIHGATASNSAKCATAALLLAEVYDDISWHLATHPDLAK